MASAMERAATKLRTGGVGAVPLNYVSARGDAETLDIMAGFLTRAYGATVSPESLVVTAGVSHGIDVVCSALTSPGDTVVVELPTYFLAASIFTDHGLRVHGIAGTASYPHGDSSGNDGGVFDVDALARQLRAGLRPRLVYLIPTHSNPRGGILPVEARRRLVLLAHKYDFFIVADDVYHLLHWGQGPPPPRFIQVEHELINPHFEDNAGSVGHPEGADATKINSAGICDVTHSCGSRIISVSSFTKILAPGLRLGWIEASPALANKLAGRGYILSGGCVAPFTASIVAEVIASGDQVAHLARLNHHYRRTSVVLADALSLYSSSLGWSFHTPVGGYFLWLKLPPRVTTELLAPAAASAGVKFLPGERSVPVALDLKLAAIYAVHDREPSAGALGDELDVSYGGYVRLCFAWLAEEEIVEGVARLAAAVQSVLLRM
jgi:DNA-binding transcriptional MocR family regulator